MKALLSDLVKFQSGVYSKTNPVADTIYLQVSDFDSRGCYKHMAVPTLLTGTTTGRHHLQDQDVLFAAKGSNNFTTIYEEDFGPAIASSSFIVLRIEKSRRSALLPAFLAWYLSHPLVLEGLKRNAVGSSMPAITMQQLSALEVNLPPVPKQELIVRLHGLHQKEATLQKRLHELKATFFQHQLYNATI